MSMVNRDRATSRGPHSKPPAKLEEEEEEEEEEEGEFEIISLSLSSEFVT